MEYVTPYLEIGGYYREVFPNVHQVELPLPFSLGIVNVYLVRLERGWLLIDCGMETEQCLAALSRACEGLGVNWTDIRQILVTHAHPDHSGLAPRLLQKTGARLMMHGHDVNLLYSMASGQGADMNRNVLGRAGTPPALREQVAAVFREIQQGFRVVNPDEFLADGESIPTTLGPLDVFWTPGHSPGHVCLYAREKRLLFSGDHLLEHITPNIGWQPERDALGDFLNSLERMKDMEIDLILPAHGGPFAGHRDLIRKTIGHHHERCAAILASLAGTPSRAHDLVAQLWKRPLSPFHYRFAIYEVLAHLEHMQRRGMVSASPNGGSPVMWSAA
ncbi:MAG: MBL fold metallo-hydrolase [Bryobacteraceae bacterium]